MKKLLMTLATVMLSLVTLGASGLAAYLVNSASAGYSFSILNFPDDNKFKDSTTVSLSTNPERGFYDTSILRLLPDDVDTTDGQTNGKDDNQATKTKSAISSILLLKVDLSAYSENMNGGTQKYISPSSVQALGDTLNKIKQNNNTAIIRFYYDGIAADVVKNPDGSPVAKVEPAKEMIVHHINAFAETFKAYGSTINAIQCGFFGLHGEGMLNTDAADAIADNYPLVLQALLNATEGTDITIAARTVAQTQSLATANSRLTIFNDSIGYSDTDNGTFSNRTTDTDWLKQQGATAMYGGAAAADIQSDGSEQTLVGAFNNQEAFVKEANKTRLTYLSSEEDEAILNLWKKQQYSGFDSVFASSSLSDYINSHLGYRLVLRVAKAIDELTGLQKDAVYNCGNNNIRLAFVLENKGFANIVKQKQAQIVITTSYGTEVCTKDISLADLDVRQISAGTLKLVTTTLNNVNLQFKDTYNVYLRISNGEAQKLDNGQYYSAIQLTNSGVYDETLQANKLMTLEVKDGPKEFEQFAVYFESDNSLNFYFRNFQTMMLPGPGDVFDGKTVSAIYPDIQNTNFKSASEVFWNEHKDKITNITVRDAAIRPENMDYWFSGMSNLKSAELSKLDTRNTTSMAHLFDGCLLLENVNVLGWNTFKTLNMENAFAGCASLSTLNLSSWNTYKCTNINSMFANCSNLNSIFVSKLWSTNSVASDGGSNVFAGDSKLVGGKGTACNGIDNIDSTYARIDIPANSTPGYLTDVADTRSFAVYSAENNSLRFYKRTSAPAVGSTFEGLPVTNVYTDIETTDYNSANEPGWYTDRLEIMSCTVVDDMISPISTYHWFANGALKKVNLAKLDVSKTANMDQMFYGSYSLKTILASNLWSTKGVVKGDNMFNGCTSLMGGMYTTYDKRNPVNYTYARIDSKEAPGYFTELSFDKHMSTRGKATSINVIIER